MDRDDREVNGHRSPEMEEEFIEWAADESEYEQDRPASDEEFYAAEYSERHRGVFGRYRAARERSRAKMRARWLHYLATAVPEDDDAPAKLPRFLQGPRGRIILGVSALVISGGWLFAVVKILS